MDIPLRNGRLLIRLLFLLSCGHHEMTLDHSVWGQHWSLVRNPPSMQENKLMSATVCYCASPWALHPRETQSHLANQLIYKSREDQIRCKSLAWKQRQIDGFAKTSNSVILYSATIALSFWVTQTMVNPFTLSWQYDNMGIDNLSYLAKDPEGRFWFIGYVLKNKTNHSLIFNLFYYITYFIIS